MFGWLDWEKLKREWKSAVVLVAGAFLETYEALVVTGMVDLPSLFPEPYNAFAGPGFMLLALAVRKWKDKTEAM